MYVYTQPLIISYLDHCYSSQLPHTLCIAIAHTFHLQFHWGHSCNFSTSQSGHWPIKYTVLWKISNSPFEQTIEVHMAITPLNGLKWTWHDCKLIPLILGWHTAHEHAQSPTKQTNNLPSYTNIFVVHLKFYLNDCFKV